MRVVVRSMSVNAQRKIAERANGLQVITPQSKHHQRWCDSYLSIYLKSLNERQNALLIEEVEDLIPEIRARVDTLLEAVWWMQRLCGRYLDPRVSDDRKDAAMAVAICSMTGDVRVGNSTLKCDFQFPNTYKRKEVFSMIDTVYLMKEVPKPIRIVRRAGVFARVRT